MKKPKRPKCLAALAIILLASSLCSAVTIKLSDAATTTDADANTYIPVIQYDGSGYTNYKITQPNLVNTLNGVSVAGYVTNNYSSNVSINAGLYVPTLNSLALSAYVTNNYGLGVSVNAPLYTPTLNSLAVGSYLTSNYGSNASINGTLYTPTLNYLALGSYVTSNYGSKVTVNNVFYATTINAGSFGNTTVNGTLYADNYDPKVVTDNYSWSISGVNSNMDFGYVDGITKRGLVISAESSAAAAAAVYLNHTHTGTSGKALQINSNGTLNAQVGVLLAMGSDDAPAIQVNTGKSALRDLTATGITANGTLYAPTFNVSALINLTPIATTPDAVTGNMFLSSTNNKLWIWISGVWNALF